jgi:hypothetical protein
MAPAPTTEIIKETRREAVCSACGRAIVKAEAVSNGKVMPFDLPIVVQAEFDTETPLRTIQLVALRSHFSSCPNNTYAGRRT